MASEGIFTRQRVAVVADDDALILRFVGSALTKHGWRVIEASDGGAALRLIDGGHVDLLVTDQDMPSIPGLSLAAILRARLPDLPVLVISGLPREGAIGEGIDFLAKPFQLADLVAAVDRLAPEVGIPARPQS